MDNNALRNRILDLIPSGVGVYDVTGNQVYKEYLNDGYFQMISAVRKERGQFDGSNTVNAVNNEDLPGLLEAMKKAIAEHTTLRYSFRVLDGEGGFQWIAIQANHEPLDEKTERFYASYYNIDEIVKARDELRANEIVINDMLKYSEMLHFTYYPDRHRREVMILPEKLQDFPKVIDDYPESFIRDGRLSPEDAETFRKMFRKIDAGEKEVECTVRVGYTEKFTWYKVHLLNFLDENGRPLRAIGNAINVDQLREAEKALNDEKLRMKTIERGVLTVACFDVTDDRMIESYSDPRAASDEPVPEKIKEEAFEADEDLKTQSPETLACLFDAMKQIPGKEDRLKFMKAGSHKGMLKNYEDGNREMKIEYRRIVSGEIIWASTRVALLPDPESGNIMAFFYTVDINDHKIRKQITTRLVNGSYMMTCYLDRKKGTVCILSGNVENTGNTENAESTDKREMDEKEFEDLIRRKIDKYVYADDIEMCRRNFSVDRVIKALEKESKALEKKPLFIKSFRLTALEAHEKRPYRHMQFTAFLLDEEKRYLVMSMSDITEQFEQEQQQKEKLERAVMRAEKANMAKTDFLSRMSHDIRTPLNGIIGMTSLAMEEKDPDEVRRYLDRIDEAGHFLLGLVNDILDMSRVESGKVELRYEPYTLGEFRRYLMSVIQPLCDSRGESFIIDMNLMTDYSIIVDRLRFAQIFFNLLSNAVKFTPHGGCVRFSLTNQKITDGFMDADFVVSDNGRGMSKDFQNRMFDPFEQENTDINAVRSGSGLGLAIVKSMVELMNGTIKVESAVGKGSKFTVHLRLPVRHRIEESFSEEKKQNLIPGKHILLAEDNEINAEIVMKMLEKRGAIVERAEDGACAVEKFRQSDNYRFDIILMDIRMPLMDGLEATREIRALNRPDSKAVPIIALTANAFDEDVKNCIEAGMNFHIAKPVDAEELYRRLNEILDAR